MRKNKFFVQMIRLFFVLTFVMLLSPNYVSAQSKQSQKGLTLSPLRTELNIAPGTSLDSTLTVTNSTNKPITVDLSAEEFSVINQQYDYAFTVESNVAKWVTIKPLKIELLAGQSKQVSFAVGVPLSAEPGGRYISLFASTDIMTSDNSVSSRQRIASLLYITVLGDVSRLGNLVSLSSPWAVFDNTKWSTALQNTGTTHFRSRYNVQVKSLIGNTVASAMSGEALILPGTVRAISDVLPLPKLPGVYKIIYTIGLGDTPARVETRYMLYMPPIATAVLILFIIVIHLRLLRRRQKRHQSVCGTAV